MRLFIAEKPSVGRELSKYLPNRAQAPSNGYIVCGDDVVTWAFGHILEQAKPQDYDERYRFWKLQDLPIVPEEWKLNITESSKKQFFTIKNLVEKADTIVNAGDPDREGQLLIDEILMYLGVEKPVQRILINALDEKSIRDSLKDLRDNKDFYSLRQSALARARADWLIGMNLSRAYTLEKRIKDQAARAQKVVFPVGRVKTPTLALVVRRERELQNFKPVDYYNLHILYEHSKGEFWAKWQPKDTQEGLDSEGHLLDESIAAKLKDRLLGGEGVITASSVQKKKEGPRLPLSLSSLQVLAGKAYGLSPQEVLDLVQKLYEKKYTTYPRSDCEYLPMNQYGDRTAIVANLSRCGNKAIMDWAQGADLSIKTKAWDDSKITAHHAIIPTTVYCDLSRLNQREAQVYRLIAQAYLAQFYGDYVYEQRKITVEQEEETFIARGKRVVDLGWKALYQKQGAKDGQGAEAKGGANKDGSAKDEGEEEGEDFADSLPAVKKGDAVTAKDGKVDKRSTKPPPRFTTSSLLQAMKEIHKYVTKESVKKRLKAVAGIGTEATRASIIEELITRKFMVQEGKKKLLHPTELAFQLIDALPEELLLPDETAMWEDRLAAVSEGEDSLEDFLKDQVGFLGSLVKKVQAGCGASSLNSGASAGLVQPAEKKQCPACKEGYLVLRKGPYSTFYGCSRFPKCRHTEIVKKNEPTVGEGAGNYPSSSNYGNAGGAGNAANAANAANASGAAQAKKGRGELSSEQKADISALSQKTHTIIGEVGQYKCPRCATGYFVKEGRRWVCSNSPRCRTICADVDGVPVIYKNKGE